MIKLDFYGYFKYSISNFECTVSESTGRGIPLRAFSFMLSNSISSSLRRQINRYLNTEGRV
jgi:hypothetical protein